MTHHTITEALATALEELVALEADGRQASEGAIESWERARRVAAAYRAQEAAPAAAEGREARKAARVHAMVNEGPYPGMSGAFDAHMGAACWTDHAYRQDAATWAAAWRAALAAHPQPAQGEAVVKGMSFAEAKKVILELPTDAARGLAISLLIQNGILEKYAAGMAGQGLTAQQMAVVRFLAGEDTLRGVWFDERPEGEPRYWWRTELWSAFGIHPASNKPAGSGEASNG